MRIVADTNILIGSIFWNGIPYKVIQQALDGKLEICTSKAILNEVRKTLKDPKEGFALSEQEIDDIIDGILLYAKLVEPMEVMDIVKRDPKDNMVIACAIAAGAHCIVTRDKDLLTLKEYEKIKIITPEEFIKR